VTDRTITLTPTEGDRATCKNCGRPITFAQYRDVGSYEPDYDPNDDPVVWRHKGGYASCGGGKAEPGPKRLDISTLAARCHANSARWFPTNHLSERTAITHCTLGLAGEAGEVANKVKKFYGYTDQAVPDDLRAAIVEELIDTLIYDLVLLDVLGADIPAEVERVVAKCVGRWGAEA
jgi:NTP pyrophosphatase (non-canonical NTP hydrolase)